MSHGIKLMLALCESDTGLQDFIRLQPSEDDFKGEAERTLFEFAVKHLNKHGALPKWATVQEAANQEDWGIALPSTSAAPEPPSFYYDKVRERAVHLGMKSAMTQATTILNSGDPEAALNLMLQETQRLSLRQNKNKIVNYAEEGFKLIKNHLAAAVTEYGKGLMFGWPYLDGMTGGLVGGDVVSFIGRPAQGKTFAMLWGAQYCWEVQQHIPLFVSMEMKTAVLAQRLAAMQSRINLTHIKTGQLDKQKQAIPMFQVLKKNQKRQPFWIIDGALAVNISQIKTYIQQLKPTVLFVDGAYLLRHENPKINRYERVTDNAERLKGEIGEYFGIPVVISYQFNRESTKQKAGVTPGLEHIAYTDAIGQLSSLVVGMTQEDSVETMLRRRIDIMKGRSGEIGSFYINWRFSHPDAMNFSQWVEPSISDLSYV